MTRSSYLRILGVLFTISLVAGTIYLIVTIFKSGIAFFEVDQVGLGILYIFIAIIILAIGIFVSLWPIIISYSVAELLESNVTINQLRKKINSVENTVDQVVTKTVPNKKVEDSKNQISTFDLKARENVTLSNIKVGDIVFSNKHKYVEEIKQSIHPGDKLLINEIKPNGDIIVQVDKEFYSFVATVKVEDLKK